MGVVRDQSKTDSRKTRNAIGADRGTHASFFGPLTAGWTVQALPYRELKRRFWHISPGFLAFGLLVIPHADPISATLQLIILTCCLTIGMWILFGFRQIQRCGEGAGLGAVGGYALSVLGTSFLFPRHLELGLAVLAILAFGDGSATLLGSVFRGPRLPWNSGKSWIGLLGFVAVGSAMAAWTRSNCAPIWRSRKAASAAKIPRMAICKREVRRWKDGLLGPQVPRSWRYQG